MDAYVFSLEQNKLNIHRMGWNYEAGTFDAHGFRKEEEIENNRNFGRLEKINFWVVLQKDNFLRTLRATFVVALNASSLSYISLPFLTLSLSLHFLVQWRPLNLVTAQPSDTL